MYEVEYELQQVLLKIEGFEAIRQLENRDRAILSAVHIAGLCGFKSGVRSIGKADGSVENNEEFPVPEWAGDVVAYIELPTGEISYFLSKDHSQWTGYTRQVKLARIKDYLEGKYVALDEAPSTEVQ